MLIRPAVIGAAFDHVEHAGAVAVCVQFLLPSLATPTVMFGCVVAVLCIHIALLRVTP